MTDRQRFIVVPYLELKAEQGPHAFEFKTAQRNEHGSIGAGITYAGKNLFVRFDKRTTPFGITPIHEKQASKDKKDKGKVVGFSLACSFKRSSQEGELDPYEEKTRELDEFFMDVAHQNQVAWGLGSATHPVLRSGARGSIAGLDDEGFEGLWKRLARASFKVNPETKDREYLDYPARYEVSVPFKEVTGEKDVYVFPNVKFYDEHGEEVNVDSTNVADYCPRFSEVSLLVSWSRVTCGKAFGITMKPRLQQIRVYPSSARPTDNVLGDEVYDEDVQPVDIGSLGLGGGGSAGGGGARRTETKPVSNSQYSPDDTENAYNEGDDVVEPTPVARAVQRVTQAQTSAPTPTATAPASAPTAPVQRRVIRKT